jgi:hypothetical protein
MFIQHACMVSPRSVVRFLDEKEKERTLVARGDQFLSLDWTIATKSTTRWSLMNQLQDVATLVLWNLCANQLKWSHFENFKQACFAS